MELSEQDRRALERLEEQLWREETRFDQQRMMEIIAPDFVEFGRSGRIYSRHDSLAAARRPINSVIPLPDFQARLIHPDVAQVTYNSVVADGEVVQRARRSSIWTRIPGGWVLRFHQGTPYDIE